MADNIAKFDVELTDHVTAPAARIADAIGRIEGRIQGMQGSVGGMAKWKGWDEFESRARGIGARIDGWMQPGINAVKGFVEQTVQGVMHTAEFSEASKIALHSLTGSTEMGEAAFTAARGAAQEYNMDLEDTVHNMQHLLAMQFSVGEALTQIKLSQDLKSIGATAQQAESALRAITQIKAKGKLQSEELVGQLAETGLSTSLVYEALAKNLGKSEDQVRKMLSQGQISAEVGIKAIQDAIVKKTHETAPGEAAKRMGNTLAGMKQRAANIGSEFYMKITEGIEKLGPRLNTILGKYAEIVGRIDVGKTAAVVSKIVDYIVAGAELTKAFFVGFIDGFNAMEGMSGEFKLTEESLERAKEWGGKVFALVEKMVWAVEKLIDWGPTLLNDWTLWGLVIARAGVGIIELVANLKKAKAAWEGISEGASWLSRLGKVAAPVATGVAEAAATGAAAAAATTAGVAAAGAVEGAAVAGVAGAGAVEGAAALGVAGTLGPILLAALPWIGAIIAVLGAGYLLYKLYDYVMHGDLERAKAKEAAKDLEASRARMREDEVRRAAATDTDDDVRLPELHRRVDQSGLLLSSQAGIGLDAGQTQSGNIWWEAQERIAAQKAGGNAATLASMNPLPEAPLMNNAPPLNAQDAQAAMSAQLQSMAGKPTQVTLENTSHYHITGSPSDAQIQKTVQETQSTMTKSLQSMRQQLGTPPQSSPTG